MSASSSSNPPGAPATPAKRACDSCHRRKVKCLPISEAIRQCRNCTAAGLACTFNNKVQKKGPKGSRAKVLSEIRETQKLISPRPPYENSSIRSSRSSSPCFDRTPGLMSEELVNACVKYFCEYMYHSQPILHFPGILSSVQSMNHSIDAYCQITALCAYVLLQPQTHLPPGLRMLIETDRRSNRCYAKRLLDEAIRVRKGLEWSESPNLLTIYTSYFLSRAQHCLGKDSAWIYLREATTVADLLGLQHEETYTGDSLDQHTKRKLFYVLFITERVYAIRNHRPVSLYPTTNLPDPRDEPENIGTGDLSGFIQLIKLYRIFDNGFFAFWNRSTNDFQPHWLERIQAQLSSASTLCVNIPEVSAIDMKISSNWLRVVVWQLSMMQNMSPMLMDSSGVSRALVDICRELVEHCSSPTFTQGGMEIHGLDLAEKLFDVSITLSDYLEILPPQLQMDAKEYLQTLFIILTTLTAAHDRLVPTLHSKIIHYFPSTTNNNYQAMQAGMVVNGSIQEMYNINIAPQTMPIPGLSNPLSVLVSQEGLYPGMISNAAHPSFASYSPHSPHSSHPNGHWDSFHG